jgi:cell shape-determining protein MreD
MVVHYLILPGWWCITSSFLDGGALPHPSWMVVHYLILPGWWWMVVHYLIQPGAAAVCLVVLAGVCQP